MCKSSCKFVLDHNVHECPWRVSVWRANLHGIPVLLGISRTEQADVLHERDICGERQKDSVSEKITIRVPCFETGAVFL